MTGLPLGEVLTRRGASGPYCAIFSQFTLYYDGQENCDSNICSFYIEGGTKLLCKMLFRKESMTSASPDSSKLFAR